MRRIGGDAAKSENTEGKSVKKIVSVLLAGASLATVCAAHEAYAAAEPSASPAVADEATLGEIVVTARRKSESLQEVPQTVNAVTSESLQKLNITQFQDVQRVVPGLSLTSGTGSQASASLRGITFQQTTGAQPTVALYLNDAPVAPGVLFQPMYDVGQVEVLKGPQGTTRGIAAPSGAITVTTHRPDLSNFGGYAATTLTDLQGRNVQGAINVPLIKDVLAIRIAGLFDENSVDGVRSIHSSLRPRAATSSERFSVSFEPNDTFTADVTYQHLDSSSSFFPQVSGPGQGAFSIGATAFPASTNPALTPEMRASVSDGPNRSREHQDVVIARMDSRLFGQHFSYVGYYLNDKGFNADASTGDLGNLLPGVELTQNATTINRHTSQEFRVASDPAPGRFFDYTLGAFYDWRPTKGTFNPLGPLTPGAFGPQPVPNLAAFDPAYQIPPSVNLNQGVQETSIFGNVALHLGDKTELSGGIRHIWSIARYQTTLNVGSGLFNLPALGLPPLPCTAIGLGAGPSAGTCVISPAALGVALPPAPQARFSETPNIYVVSFSHHFTRDLLFYVNTGTSYRPPVATVGLNGDLLTSTIPQLQALTIHPSEHSRTYELGVKSTFLDGRARLNASIFQQRFHNLPIQTGYVSYLQTANNPASATNFQLTASVDALVRGFDIDGAFQVTPNWNISAQMSYADGSIEGSQVPCNLTNAAGVPVYNVGGIISFCPGGSASRLPYWNATFQTEYFHPINDTVEGFVRGLATLYPENKNRVEPNFTVDQYSLVNLYAGVRSHDGAWEVSFFARNAFNAQRTTDTSTVPANLNASLSQFFPSLIHPTGYYLTQVTPRREVGINLRYAWGSR
jgi:iron complex outermembrane receptor protein